jgi:hypothetical protein
MYFFRAIKEGNPPKGYKGGKWSTGDHGGLGIDFRLGPVILGIEGTYLATKPNFNAGEVTLDGVTVTGNLGFRF